jgi:hypothetical protein
VLKHIRIRRKNGMNECEQKEKRHNEIRKANMVRRFRLDLICETCKTVHVDVPVQHDEDGAYAEIDTVPCRSDKCTARLCHSCPQFECDGCRLPHCESHRVRFGDQSLCPVCMAEVSEEAAVVTEEEVRRYTQCAMDIPDEAIEALLAAMDAEDMLVATSTHREN